MPFYHHCGKLPEKKHTTFYRPESKELYREELVSLAGFSGGYSTKYHLSLPPQLKEVRAFPVNLPDVWEDAPLKHYHFATDQDPVPGNYLSARQVLLQNQFCSITVAAPTEPLIPFFENAYAHELVFVHHGHGTYASEYGHLSLSPGDYLVIPKGTKGQMTFEDWGKPPESLVKLLIIESPHPFRIPKAFRNDEGQILEHAPYCERDFQVPQLHDPIEKTEDYSLILKAGDRCYEYTLPHHPFDVVGWDGFLYPFTFNIHDYCPVVGKLHQPPPVHSVFHTERLVICNFVPRLFDFHPQAIPAPYFHSNVDSEEILYYVDGNFMSRSGIQSGSMTLHPMGLPHGPQPGKTEASVGQASVEEYAVMIDTFDPLHLTQFAKSLQVESYETSWMSS